MSQVFVLVAERPSQRPLKLREEPMLGARGIVRFNDYVVRRLSGWFAEHMPLCLKNAGGSLYIRRTEK